MIVRFVAEGDSLIAELLQPLFVDSESNVTRFRQRVVAKDICHVVEQVGGCEQDGGWLNAVDVVQQELRVSVSLIGGLRKPVAGCLLILVNLPSLEVQLPQQILRVGIAVAGGAVQI